MDGISGKRSVNKLSPTKRSSLVMRNTSSFSGHRPQPCNRQACSSKLNIIKGGQGGGAGCSHKTKSVRSSVCPSGGKEVRGSSSKCGSSASAMRNPKKEAQDKIAALQLETDSSETSSVRDQLEVPEVVLPAGKISKQIEKSSKKGVAIMEVGSSSSETASVLGSRSSSNIKSSTSSKARSFRQQPPNPNTSQSGLRDLRCNSMADVISSSSSTLEKRNLNKRKDSSKGQTSEGETNTSRGKKTHDTFRSTRNGVSITESRSETGGMELNRSIASVGMRRSSRSPSERMTRRSSLSESRYTFPRLTHQDLSIDGNASGSSSSYELSSESIYRRFAINNRPGSSSGLSPDAELSSPDTRGTSSRSLLNWENFPQYTMEGISEVLSALDRIEHDNLNFEQLVSLETNLFLNGLNIYDQHRDMRMDIDDMSYEELLALGERMGTVSTALTEEALSKCLKKESYQKAKYDDEAATVVEKDETKCSICQEEYVDEDEVGRLHCEHTYHVECINQWLRLKNWCPICKGSAETSPPSPRP